MIRSLARISLPASLLAIAGAAMASPPPFTVSSVVRSGEVVPGAGQISRAGAFGAGQGRGILKVAVNDAGAWLIDVHVVQTDTTLDEALLRSATGLTPYVLEGVAGYLAEPTSDYIANNFHSLSLNNAGNIGMAMGLFDDEFAQTNPSSAAYFNTSRVVAIEGGLVSTAGLAAGTTWERFNANSVVRLVDGGQMLIVSTVNEQGIIRRVVIVAQVDATGNILSRTLIAKEGGPVGVSADTWQTIAGGGHASAVNASGAAVFSGTTLAGTNGVYSSAAGFVAVQGTPSPVDGADWGSLLGAPVDINGSGLVAIRGPLADGNGEYVEKMSIDAGDEADTADRTFGNGPLTRIEGELSDDHDVDMFRIMVTDAGAFSATTVPDPGSGFPGAAWDTVLTVIASPENGTRGRVQCDDASGSLVQSTLGGTSLISGREYYICISTKKSRAVAQTWHYATDSFPQQDIWFGDPAGLTIASGLVFWPDPSTGLLSSRTTTGTPQADIAAPLLSPHIVANPVTGRVFWANRGGTGGPKILSANFDGSAVQEVVNIQGFGTLTASETTGMAIDTVNGKLYWSRSVYGEINRCNLDGSSPERVLQDYPPTEGAFPPGDPTGTLAPSSLAVDAAGGRVYWVNTFLDRIERANVDGTGRTTLAIGAGARSLTIDAAAGKLYWSNPAGDRIQRSNLDGTALEDVVLASAPAAIAIDPVGSRLYWTNTTDRAIRSATLAGAGPAHFTDVAADIGERLADAVGAGSAFISWTRTGSASGPSLPYSIRLTGASFRHENAVIAKGTQKVVATGDIIPGTSPYRITIIGTATSPVQISDRGDVLWVGQFNQPTIYNNYLFDALFWNGERVLASMDIPTGTEIADQKIINFYRTPYSFSQSRSGEYAVVSVNMQDPPYNFTPQRDNALLIEFTLPDECIADFDGSGAVAVPDIFAFLSAWFASSPSADIDGVPGVSVPDIFAFLSLWFAGCP